MPSDRNRYDIVSIALVVTIDLSVMRVCLASKTWMITKYVKHAASYQDLHGSHS